MALTFTLNTPVLAETGEPMSTAYARVKITYPITEDAATLVIQLWRSEADYLAGRKEIWLPEIPIEFKLFTTSITGGQYATLGNSAILTTLANVLEDGDSHGQYPSNFPAWAGLKDLDAANTVGVVLPS